MIVSVNWVSFLGCPGKKNGGSVLRPRVLEAVVSYAPKGVRLMWGPEKASQRRAKAEPHRPYVLRLLSNPSGK